MKQPWFIFLSTLLLGTVCASCNSDDEEEEWRDANIAYMSNVAKKTGVHAIGDSLNGFTGIYYEVLEAGDSTTDKPMIGDVVTVDYWGWLYNETETFDSDTDYDFTVGSSDIDGWSLAIQHMRVGDKWKIYIPYNLAYGSSEYNDIPAYSALTFTIKLKEITTTRDTTGTEAVI